MRSRRGAYPPAGDVRPLTRRALLRCADVRASCENRPGVYRMIGPGDEVLYVGKSVRVRTRCCRTSARTAARRPRRSSATRTASTGSTRRASSRRCCGDAQHPEVAAAVQRRAQARPRLLLRQADARGSAATASCARCSTTARSTSARSAVRRVRESSGSARPARAARLCRRDTACASPTSSTCSAPRPQPLCMRADVRKCWRRAPAAARSASTAHRSSSRAASSTATPTCRSPSCASAWTPPRTGCTSSTPRSCATACTAWRTHARSWSRCAASSSRCRSSTRCPAIDGDDRVYVIRRGSIREEAACAGRRRGARRVPRTGARLLQRPRDVRPCGADAGRGDPAARALVPAATADRRPADPPTRRPADPPTRRPADPPTPDRRPPTRRQALSRRSR
jgi:excinuclease ABC subunit C